MQQFKYDENNGLNYELHGEQYYPCLALLTEKEKPIGLWGQRHLTYIQQHRKVTYTNLLVSGKINAYLCEIDKQADELYSRLVKELAEKQGVTEQMKDKNQFEWVGKMNNIKNCAIEIVNCELIYR